jgi:hypothetical protein
MPKAKKAPPSASSTSDSLDPSLDAAKPLALIDRIPKEKRIRRQELPDEAPHRAQPLDKHSENLRYRAAYLANLVADDIAALFRIKGKKDHNYLKALVWNFGVLFDKASSGGDTGAVTVRIPTKLLENIKLVIAAQVERKAAKLDTLSSPSVIESTSYKQVVADGVAELPAPSAAEPTDRPGGTLAPAPPGGSSSGTVTVD